MIRTTIPHLAALSTVALLLGAPAYAVNTVGDLDLLSSGTVPPNVMIIFDNSGSMDNSLEGSTRIEIAGDAVKDLIDNLYPDDGMGGYDATVRLGLVLFDTSPARNGGNIAIQIADNN